MGVAQYLTGLVLGAAALVAVVAGALAVRRRLAPELAGPAAWVADSVLVLALLVVALEVVGVLGLLHRWGAAVGCGLVGAAAWWLARRGSPTPAPVPAPAPAPAPAQAAAAVAVAVAVSPASRGARRAGLVRWAVLVALAVVGAPWLAWTVFAYRHGMETIDTLWYHLPFAARFVQLGSILHLQYFDADPVTVFYPANSELLHALGLALFHSDFLSPLVNLGWAALALTAAWALGRPFGRGPYCTIGVAVVLATPGLVDSQPGGAYNDVVCIALLLSSAALLVNGHARSAQGEAITWSPLSGLAALAAGLALGTKFTMIVPALALGAGSVAISARGTRWRQAVIWAAGLVVLGGYWYLRNWITAGNPIPSVALSLGPLALPAPHVTTPTFTVAQYLFSGHIWTGFFLPGLRQSLGLAWWALMLGGATGCLAALLAGVDRVIRLLGAVGVLSAGAFLVTPQFLGLPGLPVFFVDNVRYADTALALGLALAPITLGLRSSRRAAGWVGLVLVALLATELDPGVWPTGLAVKPFSRPIHGTDAAAGAALAVILFGAGAWWWRTGRPAPAGSPPGRVPPGRIAGGAMAAVGIIVAVGAGLLANSYSQRRDAATPPLPRIYAWAQHTRDTRIGIAGFDLQYPLYGANESNYVQYVGASAPHAGFRAISSCPAWRRAVNRGRYRWLVVTPAGFPFGTAANVAPEIAWTAGQRVSEVISERGSAGALAVLYRVTGPLDPGSCPA
jgi:hypothetical protein